MLLKVISLSILFCLTSSISNAANSNHNRLSMVLENRVTEPNNTLYISSKPRDNPQLTIVSDRLQLSSALQTELAQKIALTRKKIVRLNKFIDRENAPNIGLVYIHQGYEKWSLHFTYGGYLLNTKASIIVNTSEIFKFKKVFANTEFLQIDCSRYQTTRYMNQLGAILHQQ